MQFSTRTSTDWFVMERLQHISVQILAGGYRDLSDLILLKCF